MAEPPIASPLSSARTRGTNHDWPVTTGAPRPGRPVTTGVRTRGFDRQSLEMSTTTAAVHMRPAFNMDLHHISSTASTVDGRDLRGSTQLHPSGLSTRQTSQSIGAPSLCFGDRHTDLEDAQLLLSMQHERPQSAQYLHQPIYNELYREEFDDQFYAVCDPRRAPDNVSYRHSELMQHQSELNYDLQHSSSSANIEAARSTITSQQIPSEFTNQEYSTAPRLNIQSLSERLRAAPVSQFQSLNGKINSANNLVSSRALQIESQADAAIDLQSRCSSPRSEVSSVVESIQDAIENIERKISSIVSSSRSSLQASYPAKTSSSNIDARKRLTPPVLDTQSFQRLVDSVKRDPPVLRLASTAQNQQSGSVSTGIKMSTNRPQTGLNYSATGQHRSTANLNQGSNKPASSQHRPKPEAEINRSAHCQSTQLETTNQPARQSTGALRVESAVQSRVYKSLQ